MKTILVSSENPAAFKVYSNTLDDSRFNIKYWPISIKSSPNSQHSSVKRKWLFDSWPGVFIVRYLLCYPLSILFEIKIKFRLYFLNRAFIKTPISAVIVSSDRGISWDLILCLWAKKKGIPIIVLEYAFSSGFESALKTRTQKIFKFNNFSSKTVMKGISFYRPHHEISLSKMDALPENPWTLGTGLSDYVIVSTQYEANRLLKNGTKKIKIKVLGSVEIDNVINNHNLRTEEDTINSCIISLPQYWEHGLLSKETHFRYIKGLLKILRKHFKNVFVSLHPKMCTGNYKKLIIDEKCILLSQPLSKSMGLAHTFIGTYTTTILWAIILNKRIILLDYANLDYEDFYPEYKFSLCKSNEHLENYLIRNSSDINYDEFDVGYDFNNSSKKNINDFIDTL